jgi:putative tryptophan/tyrosine transport system substrate-binding protein
MRRREFIAGLGSAAATGPLVARAQQPAMPVIGFLSGWSSKDSIDALVMFRRGLAEVGYIEGKNVVIEFRWAEGHFDRLQAMLEDLVQRQVAVIVIANTTAAALAAKAATKTIPIVFGLGSDPVKIGLVASLNRPGGNVTGVAQLAQDATQKRFELLHELVPEARSIAFIVNPTNAVLAEVDSQEARSAANALGINLLVLNASTPNEIDEAFATMVRERVDAFLTNSESYFMLQRVQFAVLAARHALPAMYAFRQNTEAGGLVSYGTDIIDANRVVGGYTGRILKGEKPSDLPVQLSTRIELIVNTKAAKAIGLTVPPSILVRADEVIE